ncbi:response regulator [Bacteroidetes/Chlorobi group bacterium Naka2016]|jgi:CheY-like chemotaxis protein/glycine cleavage system H lipoate-binding protein|nr:MAG: response regulator [Bacteroidetes/Chlorobi group bacterium Naka2016]
MENSKIKILVIDDEQIVLDSIKRLLKKDENYIIETALSAAEGLAKIDEFKPNVILTDLMMPEIDGLELLKKVKEKDEKIFVIMITGYATINSALQAMQLGAFDYIAKPFTREELRRVIERAASLVEVQKSSPIKSPLQNEIIGNIQGIGQYSWLMMNDEGLVVLGAERAFLYSVGKIQTVYLPSVGDEIRQGSVFFQIFSSDLRTQSIYSPLSGTVVEVNERVLKNPEIAVLDPYGEGWLIKIKPNNFEDDMKTLGLL